VAPLLSNPDNQRLSGFFYVIDVKLQILGKQEALNVVIPSGVEESPMHTLPPQHSIPSAKSFLSSNFTN
jgi:hypothetical protein